jgi:hypothetical protein
MVRRVRYSVWVALGWISLYLVLWLLGSFLVLGLAGAVVGNLVPPAAPVLRDPPGWGLATLAGFVVLGSVLHSRRYWKRLLDRSPQIELHPTFLRAKPLGNDILWKDVEDIKGWQSGVGSDEGSTQLYLDLVGGRRVALDLVGLNIGMQRLYKLACEAREADSERRRAGDGFDPAKEAAPSSESARTHGYSTGELGEEVARFGAVARATVSIICGAGIMVALTAFGIILDLANGRDVPSAGTLAVGITSAAIGLPFMLFGVIIGRVGLVLCQNGLTYFGPLRTYTVRYGDILRMSVMSVRRAGERESTPVTLELMLRDGQVVKLSHLKDLAAAGQRIEELRSAAHREDSTKGAERSATGDSPRD